MISSLEIEGFRALERFEMADLGRVNLLVGTNNSGKTSILEALHILTSRADPRDLWHILSRRGEKPIEGARRREPGGPEVDASHLFHGHGLRVGSTFRLSATNGNSQRSLSVEVAELTEKEQASVRVPDGGMPRIGLRLKGSPAPLTALIPLNSSGGLSSDTLDIPRRARRQRTPEDVPRVQFITTEAMDGDDLVRMWNAIALTPDEDLVLATLACLDPDIERIAAQASPHYWSGINSRSGFIVKHKRFDSPVPIGSMGDGIWRLLSLAIAITQCRNGVLLVDEIDTGLHHSAMSDMWKLILHAADTFDVQVCATTHSSDCVNSLAVTASEYLPDSDSDAPRVSFQRIEPDRHDATPYTPEEIRIAARHSLEIR